MFMLHINFQINICSIILLIDMPLLKFQISFLKWEEGRKQLLQILVHNEVRNKPHNEDKQLYNICMILSHNMRQDTVAD